MTQEPPMTTAEQRREAITKQAHRDPVAAATTPHKLCPFWSRIAYTKKGLLALCSYYDLEDQREKGYGEPEGWVRLEECQVDRAFNLEAAQLTPAFILNGMHIANNRGNPGLRFGIVVPDVIVAALGTQDFDRAWELALSWANEEVEE